MMDLAEISRLMTDLESDRAERTVSVRNVDKFCEAICAFANDLPNHGRPGYLLVGVNDDGKPSGLEVTDQLLQNLAAHRSNGNILPLPQMNVQKVSIDGADIAVVEVLPSDMPPVRYRGRIWIRVGPTRAVASETEERVLVERRTSRFKTWDLRPCGDATLDDLALDLFTLNYLPAAVSPETAAANGREIREQLAALRFFDLTVDRPTNGAMLLFGRDPRSFVEGAYVRYLRYAGKAFSDDVEVEREMAGDALTLMRSLDILTAELARGRPVRQESLRDVTVYDYPPLALHEIFMNAVIHRNYEASTTPVSINHFTDRIEVMNPGGLYGDLTRELFPRGTSYRNPVVAEAAKTLGFVNRYGRGIAIANAELEKNACEPVEFDIGDNHLLATLKVRK